MPTTYEAALAWMKSRGVKMTKPGPETDGCDGFRVFLPGHDVSRLGMFENHLRGV